MMRFRPAVVFALAALIAGGPAAAENKWPYDPSPLLPFGAPNPAQTDPEARIFDPLIGVHDCVHQRTDYETKKVTEAEAVWAWYHDMNGYGIRDLYRYGERAPASQRVYDPEKKEWHVFYFLGQNVYYAGEWVGGAKGDRLVFEMQDMLGDRKALSRLEYFDIKPDSFKWTSSNIDNETGETFVDWAISCKRRR